MSKEALDYSELSPKSRVAYRDRANRLFERCNKERSKKRLPVPTSPKHFVQWLGDLRPLYLPRSWRLYKAACLYVIHEEPWLLWPELDGSIARRCALELRAFTQSPCHRERGNTSSMKLKTVRDADLDALTDYYGARRSEHGTNILRFLRFNRFIGLRPCECIRTRMTWDPSERTLVFVVMNAKHNDIRAHGEIRTITVDDPTPDLLDNALAFFKFVHTEFKAPDGLDRIEAWTDHCDLMQDALRRACRKLWPRRKKQLTFYSARHEAASFFKTYRPPEEVAALMGHAVDETAYSNYARAKANGGAVAPEDVSSLPRPQPEEVAQVRQVKTDDYPRKVSNDKSQTKPAHQKR